MSRPAFLPAIALLALFASSVVHAQTRTLTGTVMVANADVPFAGAEVRLLDSDESVCADVGGDFSIPVPVSGEARLRITPIGYAPQEIVVAQGEQSMEVSLGDHVYVLDEVKVVGYSLGMAANRASGNSIATLSSGDLGVVPAQSIESAMQGKIAGAHIQANNGAPGASYQIILRGVNTILGTPDPMVVVDGIIINAGSVGGTPSNAVTRGGSMRSNAGAGSRLADINPMDVERIEVLRGPSASAMYGSKAGNGVVIVTTRRGPPPPRIEDSGRTGEALRCFVPGGGLIQVRDM
jgi:TonB-dependent SusC/RagA subfamily outer membrane receptor